MPLKYAIIAITAMNTTVLKLMIKVRGDERRPDCSQDLNLMAEVDRNAETRERFARDHKRPLRLIQS